MVQFKYKDASFFKSNTRVQLRCLPRNAAADLILTADGTMLKLDNKKMDGRECVYTMRPMAKGGIAQSVL
jgi:hypothetical protein